jgi:Domain of unknown function (DUF4157)
MQSRFGNAGTAAMLARAGLGESSDRLASSAPEPTRVLSTAQMLFASGALQPKLEVGSADHPLEREADAFADRVLRKPDGACCMACATGGSCDTKRAVRRLAATGAQSLSPRSEAQARQLTQGGEPLPETVRANMEPRFGADFSDVRIHRDPAAAESAQDLGARAWTLGQHIAFGDGEWAPGTPTGDHLIAHELAHTLQDSDAGNAAPIHRDLLDDLADAVETVADGAEAGFDAATDAVGGAIDTVTDVAGEAWDVASDAAGEAWDVASGVAGGAVDWLLTTGGQLALSAANLLAEQFGGSVEYGKDGLIITLPEIDLFDPRRIVIVAPERREFITLLAAGTAIGPVILIGRIGVPITAPALTAFIGPGRLHGIRIRIDPVGDAYSAEGQLYVGAALNVWVQTGHAARVDAITVIPTEIPIPVEVSLEGGLLLTLNGSAVVSLNEHAVLSYLSGKIGLDLNTQLRLGVIFSADLNAYLNAQLYDFEVCESIWPIEGAQWEESEAAALA